MCRHLNGCEGKCSPVFGNFAVCKYFTPSQAGLNPSSLKPGFFRSASLLWLGFVFKQLTDNWWVWNVSVENLWWGVEKGKLFWCFWHCLRSRSLPGWSYGLFGCNSKSQDKFLLFPLCFQAFTLQSHEAQLSPQPLQVEPGWNPTTTCDFNLLIKKKFCRCEMGSSISWVIFCQIKWKFMSGEIRHLDLRERQFISVSFGNEDGWWLCSL